MADIGSYIAQIIDRAAAPIEQHTIQFFSNSNPGDPENLPVSLGSGVLLKHGDHHYIATAAHVLEPRKHTHVGVYTREKDFFEVIDAHTIDIDLIDIAVWYIIPEHAAGIAPEDWWYPIENSLFNHREEPLDKYLVFGFPAKKYKIDKKTNAITQYPFKFLTRGYSASPHTNHANYDPRLNFLMEFHKTKTRDVKSGRRENAPDPYGMSGCGLWNFNGNEFRLVGIMTEWKQPKEHIPALMGTRIEHVMRAITDFENRNCSGITH